jgi:hypothetical protein
LLIEAAITSRFEKEYDKHFVWNMTSILVDDIDYLWFIKSPVLYEMNTHAIDKRTTFAVLLSDTAGRRYGLHKVKMERKASVG